MLPIKNLTKNGYLRILSSESVSNILRRHLTEEINVQYRRNIVGYLVSQREKFLSKNIHSDTVNRKLIANFSSDSDKGYSTDSELTPVQFEKVSDETLESLTEYFDELIEQSPQLTDADVSYGDGVLTVKFGKSYGTYVINRQTPNKQIWLSSPKSGPKRYDFVNGRWIYKYDGKTLHELLNNEIPAIIMNPTCFDKCSFSGKEKEAAMNSL
ncbi:frataxin homolog, mitochondrial [Hylaeus anthracinus]|uniref:frataxin homolog, mitochondrial n=1 Tax=Hylaeus anthracinus TaxID=313031 RepID=UPI0023B9A08E|nr:frataxin homolog, mitochondrial [Hylaeus anthracinus]